MAERVQACDESFTELYRAIQFSKLIPDTELDIIIKRRRQFEHEIRKIGNDSEHEILSYIIYDQDLAALFKDKIRIASKIDKVMDRTAEKKCERIGLMLNNNVQKLYLEILRRYPNNLHNWALYLEFCGRMKMYKLEDSMIDTLLKRHSDKPITFAYAAELKFKATKSHEKARTILLRGLHLHDTNPDLYLELLKLELDFTQMLKKNYSDDKNKDVDSLPDEIFNGITCQIVYESAKKRIGIHNNTLPFYKQLLELYKEHEFTRDFQNTIIRDILKDFPMSELFQDLLARSHLLTKSKSSLEKSDSPYPFEEISNTYDSYCTILKSVSTPLMWKYALDFLLEMYKLSKSNVAEQIKTLYLNLVNEGHSADTLNADHYLTWIKFLKESNENPCKLSKILEHVIVNPRIYNEPKIWSDRINDLIEQNKSNLIYDTFVDGTGKLKGAGLPLYLTLIKHYKSISQVKVKEIYELGINKTQYETISKHLKVQYLKWLLENENIESVRKFYTKYRTMPPFCIEFHDTMYNIEVSEREKKKNDEQFNKNNNKLNESLEEIRYLAVMQFGKNNTDVWMNYIKNDFDYLGGRKIDKIHVQACESLKHSVQLLRDFEQKYAEWKCIGMKIESSSKTKVNDFKLETVDPDDL